MLKYLIDSPAAQTRGFVLDLDFTTGEEYSQKQYILNYDLLDGQNFTHIIQIEMDNEEIKERAANLRSTLADGVVYSR